MCYVFRLINQHTRLFATQFEFPTGRAAPSSSSAVAAAASDPDPDYPLSDDSYDYDDDAPERSAERDAANGRKNDSSNVLAAPHFAHPEYTTPVREGDTAKLECKPSNLNRQSDVLMWYNGTTLLYQSQNRVSADQRLSLDGDNTLSIADVTVADHGAYECRVLPMDVRQVVRLEVQTRPLVRIYGKEGRDISEQLVQLHQGEPFEMECRGSGRPLPHRVFWSADGQRVQSTNGVLVQGGWLVIKAAGHEHVRKYQCLADNGVTVGHAGVSITVRCKCAPPAG